MLGKGIQGFAADIVHMPVGTDKISPVLVAVTVCRAVKEGIGTRIGLWICSIRELITDCVYGMLQGGIRTASPVCGS